jgi:hypothetical protein
LLLNYEKIKFVVYLGLKIRFSFNYKTTGLISTTIDMKKGLLFIGLALISLNAYKAKAQANVVITDPTSTTTGGSDNTLLGVGAGNKNMSGHGNLIIGRAAGIQNMAGTQNAFIGGSSGRDNTSGSYNSFLGYEAGSNNTVGSNNSFLGNGAGYTNTDGYNNMFGGYRSGYLNTVGHHNVFMGAGAGYANSTGSDNTFIGADAGGANTTAGGNVFIGSLSGASATSGTQNTFVGAQAGQNTTTASANSFMGYRAGVSNTIGNFNSFIGVQAGQANTTGSSNYFFGTNSGAANTTGSGNYFLGDNAGGGNSSGGFNIYIGANAGNGPGVNGSNNLSIGFESGRFNQSGTNNTFLGFRADAGAASLSNATAIGNNARVNISNALVLGSGVNVGIGTSSPLARLHLTSGTSGQSGLRLENLTSASTASLVNQTKFLTVDGSGNVVLGSLNGSGRLGASEWYSAGGQLYNSNEGGVVIGQGVHQTPSDYNLFVSKGILTEKVKVAIKNTGEWSDFVFAQDYRLRSLKEVARYINVHKHLPGVASAAEVVAEGMDVGKMQAKLLEKVEELTLYLIQLQAQNDKLTIRNKQMEMEQVKIKKQLNRLEANKHTLTRQ